MGKIKRIPVAILILFIQGYRLLISPLLGNRCRFYPSCSQYALEALRGHGLWKGFFLTIRRLARCNPFCSGGVDPVPQQIKLTRRHW